MEMVDIFNYLELRTEKELKEEVLFYIKKRLSVDLVQPINKLDILYHKLYDGYRQKKKEEEQKGKFHYKTTTANLPLIDTPLVYTSSEVMKLLKIKETTLNTYIKEKKLFPIRLDETKRSKLLFLKEDVDNLIEKRPKKSP